MMRLVDGEQRVTQQRQRTHDVGISAAGSVFAQAGILAPMKTIFHARPMVAHVLEPLFRRMSVSGAVANVVTGFVERLTLASTGMVDAQRTTGVREVHFQRLDGDGRDAPRFPSTMSLPVQVKKGEEAVLRARWALIVGWLPLTCNK